MTDSCQRKLLQALVAIAIASPSWVGADVPARQRAEVEFLLEFIRSSSCAFIRNGREYRGERAYRHVLRKYDYFRDEIDTTEEFIELSASFSTASGEPYSYRCDGEVGQPTRDVLLEALAAYRSDA